MRLILKPPPNKCLKIIAQNIKDLTIVNKGVFTSCKKNDNCPPWAISAKVIKHDKTKTVKWVINDEGATEPSPYKISAPIILGLLPNKCANIFPSLL